MGENARFKNGHARVETRVLKKVACRKNVSSLSSGRQHTGAFKSASKNAFNQDPDVTPDPQRLPIFHLILVVGEVLQWEQFLPLPGSP